MEYADTYGPTVQLHYGPLSSLVMTTDEKFTEYILSSPKLIDKSSQYDFLHNWLGTGLLTSTGLKHKKRRRMLTPSFHFSILENFVGVFDSVGEVFIRRLQKHVGEESMDIYPIVSLCTLDIICETTMGICIGALLNEYSPYVLSVKNLCRIISNRIYSVLHPKLYPLTWDHNKENTALNIVHKQTDEVIDQRMKRREGTAKENGCGGDVKRSKLAFLDILLQSSIDGEALTRAEIKEEVDTFMFEGHDTTSSAMSFTLYSLSLNPEIQRKTLEEQKMIFNDRLTCIKNTPATMLDLQNMKYLELVIKESLRLYPPVPYFGRRLTEDLEWGGILYPKGLDVGIFPFASHRDPKCFPEPEKFIPERFLDMNLKNPYVYVPFSAGPRNCIGQKFAMLELKSILSKVLRNFELLPSKPAHQLQLAAELILVSKNGIHMSLRNRNFS